MIELIRRSWWLMALRGAGGIAFGAFTLAWPRITLAALLLMFAFYAIIDGGLLIGAAIERRRRGYPFALVGFEGFLGLALGAVLLLAPDRSAAALWYCLAGWALATGLLALAGGLFSPFPGGGGLLAVVGTTSVLLATVMMLWPGKAAVAIAWLIGGYAIVSGLFLFILALDLRQIVLKQPVLP